VENKENLYSTTNYGSLGVMGVNPYAMPFSMTYRHNHNEVPQTARNKSSTRYNNLLESSISLTTSNQMQGSFHDEVIQETHPPAPDQESLVRDMMDGDDESYDNYALPL
jgi:hypothetical protein